MQYTSAMKTSFIPQVRVEPEVRAELEAVLVAGETLSEFVEASVRRAAEYRRLQTEFHARGLASLASAKKTDVSHNAETVFAPIRERAEAKRQQLLRR
jgi:hypothetical protein